MSDIQDALFTRVTGVAGVTALIGTRMYPADSVPQDPTYPFLTYQRVSTQRESVSGSDIALVWARFQFDSFADTYDDAVALAAQVRAALQRYNGTVDGVVIQQVFMANELDDFEASVEKGRVIQDYIVWYEE